MPKKSVAIWPQLSLAQTGVSPYAPRAIESAPVAAPLFWRELEDPNLTTRTYNRQSLFEELQRDGDPGQGWQQNNKSLKTACQKFENLV